MKETMTLKSTFSFIYWTEMKLERERERRWGERGNRIILLFKFLTRGSEEFIEFLACIVKYEVHNLRLRPILKPTLNVAWMGVLQQKDLFEGRKKTKTVISSWNIFSCHMYFLYTVRIKAIEFKASSVL